MPLTEVWRSVDESNFGINNACFPSDRRDHGKKDLAAYSVASDHPERAGIGMAGRRQLAYFIE